MTHSERRRRVDAIDFLADSPQPEHVLTLIAYQVPFILEQITEFDSQRLWIGPVPEVAHDHHIRAHLEAVEMLSVIAARETSDFELCGVSQEVLQAIVRRAIDTVCAYHRTDGSWHLPLMPRPWGDAWQSAFWTFRLARSVWELSRTLPASTLAAARRVVAYEADRFLGVEPPSGCLGDTKMEENAWDATLLAWAPLACPGHPHSKDWEEAAKTWAANALVRSVDHFDRSWLDGRPASDWVSSTTLFPDFTCENHGTFHVNYQACLVENAWAALAYVVSGREAPPQFVRNLREAEEVLLWLNYNDSAQMMVTGNDWPNGHGVHQSTPVSAYFTRTARALRMARANLQRCRDLLLSSDDGHLFGSTLAQNVGDQRWFFHTCNVSWLCEALYVLPLPEPEHEGSFGEGIRHFPYVEVITHRNTERLASAAWRSQYGHPVFTVLPCDRSDWQSWAPHTGIGLLRCEGVSKPSIRVISHEERETTLGFVTSGCLDHFGDDGIWAKQCLSWSVVDAQGTLLLVDCIRATRDTRIDVNHGCMFSVANDVYNGFRRCVRTGREERIVDGLSGVEKSWSFGTRLSIEGCMHILASHPLECWTPGERLPSDNRFASTHFERVLTRHKTGEFAAGSVVRAVAWVFEFGEKPAYRDVRVSMSQETCRVELSSHKGEPICGQLTLGPSCSFQFARGLQQSR